MVEPGTIEPSTGTAGTPPATGTDAEAQAIAGAQGVSPSAVDDGVTIHVLPVAEIWVCCFHVRLRKIFFFEFADDAADYTTSSSVFNTILSSVRFLA